jgi:hypothetical protein
LEARCASLQQVTTSPLSKLIVQMPLTDKHLYQGAVGLPAYAFKGVYEEVHKKRGFSMENHMAAAQAAQGQQQWEVSTEEERNKIVKRWLEAQTSGFHREKFQ